MKEILVAIGYGKFAPQYFGYAQQLAHYFDASISLVHIYNYPSSSSGYTDDTDNASSSAESEVEERAYFNSELNRLKKFSSDYGLLEFEHIKVGCIVREGDVSNELAEILDEFDYDLLVMGMRKHRLRERLLGNIVQKVIDRVDVPTLLIAPLANIRLVKDIVYATVFDVGTTETVE